MATSPSRWRRLLNQLRRWWKRPPDLPADPFAVAEPDEESVTDVRSRTFWPRKA